MTLLGQLLTTVNSTAHLYLSNWRFPPIQKSGLEAFFPPEFKNTSLSLPPLGGKPAFIGPFVEHPFFPLIKRRKISQGVVAFPPSFITILIILHICSCLHLFSMRSLNVYVCVWVTIARHCHFTDCVCTLSFSGQMHWMDRGDWAFSFFPIYLC